MPGEQTPHASFLKALSEKSSDSRVQIPPRCFEDMEGEVIDYSDASLTVRFPVKERYQNPTGMMQGGLITAAIDNTFGPLSYFVAPPSATQQLNTTYIRAVKPDDAFIEIEAVVVEQAGRQLFMNAEVRNPGGKTVAIGHASCRMIRRR